MTTTSALPASTIETMARRIIADELELVWRLAIKPSWRSMQGLCHYDIRLIELAASFESVTECERTILHEVAHAQVHEKALLNRRFRPVVGRKAGKRAAHHGADWVEAYAALLAKYGYQPEPINRYS